MAGSRIWYGGLAASVVLLIAASLGGPARAAGGQALTLGATAGTVAPLLGVNVGPDAQGPAGIDLSAAYKERGVTFIRTHDYKGAFDLTDTDYAATDRMLARIQGAGFEVYLRLGNSFGAGATQASPTEVANQAFSMLQRVQSRSAPGRPVQYVEIWNEPDNPEFWTQGEQAYIDLYITLATAIRVRYPDVKIGGPALTPAGVLLPRGREFTKKFLTQVKAAAAPIDFISWHLYSNHPSEFLSAAETYREAAISAGHGDLPQHITEWNTAYRPIGEGGRKGRPDGGVGEGKAGGKAEGKAGGKAEGKAPRGDRPMSAEAEERRAEKADPQLRIGARGSALATASWIALQMGGVDQSLFYRGSDQGTYPSAFYGMFWGDGRAKPAGWAALLWKKMADHPERLSLAGVTTGPIWALAGRSPAGGTAVLLANETDQAASWTLACPANAALPITTESIRAPAEAVTSGTQGECSGVLEAYEVRLLTWKPKR